MSDRLNDKRKRPIFIHSSIDDMTYLTPDDMRVYMHLARRANNDEGKAWPSYQSIGDHCYISKYHSADGRRKHAMSAVANLIKVGLLEKEKRINEKGNQSNIYSLLDPPIVTTQTQPVGSLQTQPVGSTETLRVGSVATPKEYPLEDTPIEDTPSDDVDDDNARERAAVFEAWQQEMPQELKPHLTKKVSDLVAEHGPASVIHGIHAAVEHDKRTFAYVAKCAKNHADGVEAPQRQNGRGRANGKSSPADGRKYSDYTTTSDLYPSTDPTGPEAAESP